MLVERYVRAVCERGLDVDSILVITYTRKAAGELRTRIRAALVERGRPDLARELDGAWISTIHGFCNRLLKAHPFAVGPRPALPRARGGRRGGAARRGVRPRARRRSAPGGRGAAPAARDVPGRRASPDAHRRLRDAALRRPRRSCSSSASARRSTSAIARLRAEAAAARGGRVGDRDPARSAGEALRVATDGSPPERVVDLSALQCRGARAASYEQARKAVERAALEELAAHDRELLQELLERFAAEYAAAKRRESAVDFEDLQLAARDLLRDDDERARRGAAPLPAGHGRRVPGHEPPPVRADRSRRAPGGDGGLHGRRRVPVDLRLPARRRRGVPRAAGAGGEPAHAHAATTARARRCSPRSTTSSAARSATSTSRSRPRPSSRTPSSGTRSSCSSRTRRATRHAASTGAQGEARRIAARVRELVDSGEALPGEIVVLFAAGTDAERYEEALTARGPSDLSRDGSRLLRPAAGRRPARVPPAPAQPLRRRRARDRPRVAVRRRLERRARPHPAQRRRGGRSSPRSSEALPEGVSAERRAAAARVPPALRAARARVRPDRARARSASRSSPSTTTTSPCSRAGTASRRFANLRKLGRLARQYEAIRGADIAGFVRFVREQDALGAKELEAVAEEEGADAVRLLTIHGAKGLEFKVVIVADAGRDIGGPRGGGRDRRALGRALRLQDGASRRAATAGPCSTSRRCARPSGEQERAERLRLYYVAMTRAIDRLIVSGAIDPERAADRDDADRLGARSARRARERRGRGGDDPVELERGEARFVLPVERTRRRPTRRRERGRRAATREHSSRSSASSRSGARALGIELPPLATIPTPPSTTCAASRTARSRSSSAARTATSPSACSAFRPSRATRRRDGGDGAGLAATEIGDAVHRLLESIPLDEPVASGPRRSSSGRCAAWYPSVSERRSSNASRASSTRTAPPRSRGGSPRLPGARPERPFAFEHDGVLLHGRLDVLWRDGERALVVDYKSNALDGAEPAEIVEAEYALQRLVYALACLRDGAEEVEVAYQFLERPEDVVSATFTQRATSERLEAELSAAIARIRAGDFRPTPSEFACAGCPALDLVCAGPRLGRRAGSLAPCASPRSTTSTGTCPRSRRCSPTSSAKASTDRRRRRQRLAGHAGRGLRSARGCRRASSCAATPTGRRSRRDGGQLGVWSARAARCEPARSRRGLAADARARDRGARRRARLPRDAASADEPIFTRITPDDERRRAARRRSTPTSSSAGTRTSSTTGGSRAGCASSIPAASACRTRAPGRVLGAARPGCRVPPDRVRRRGGRRRRSGRSARPTTRSCSS